MKKHLLSHLSSCGVKDFIFILSLKMITCILSQKSAMFKSHELKLDELLLLPKSVPLIPKSM